MVRIVAHTFGLPEQVLTPEPADLPLVASGDVLVRMLASAINPSDLIPVTGAYRHRASLPFVPGYDGVGIIENVGDGVDPALVGRRVLPLGSAGGWQTWKAVPAEWCVDVPSDLSDEQAGMAYVNPLTTRLMIQTLSPRSGDRIGVTAAASVIGRMLVRMLAAAGAQPVAIVRSSQTSTVLRDEPVAEVFLEGAPLPALVAGLDAVGGVAGARLAAAISPGGLLLHYGLLSGQPLTSSLLADTKAAVRLFKLRDWVHAVPRATLHAAMTETFADIRTGHAAAVVAASYPLSAFRDALAHNARPGRRDKVILCPYLGDPIK